MNLEQGSIFVADYEQRIVSLASFVSDLHLPYIMLVKMFEDN